MMKTTLVFGTHYSHRYLKNGTVDAICMACYLTAANAADVRILSLLESQHRCWQQEEQSRKWLTRGLSKL